MKKTNRFGFTKARIEALEKPASGRTYFYDTGCANLALCVTSTGAKTFYRYGRIEGRPVRLLLGRFPSLSVDDARKAAQSAAGDIARGIDPHARRLTARHEHTLAGLWEYWIEHAKTRKRTWAEDKRVYEKFLKRWAGRRLSSISKGDVQALHSRVGSRNGHYAANRLLALVKAMFNKAGDIGYTGANPATGVEMFPEESRERFLTGDELPRFFAALTEEPEPVQAYFLLSLLTGARRGNLQAMAWIDIDLDGARWRIPSSQAKAGKPIIVPLVGPAVVILRRRREAVGDSPWVFPAKSRSGHIAEPKFAWARILKRAKLVDVRLHDLRRTLGSWQAGAGASLPIIGRSLGHQPGSPATAVYARLDLDPVRASVTTATAAMLAAGKITFDGEVLTLPPPAKSDSDEGPAVE